MNAIWAYIRQLVGNGKAATIGIFIFIIVLVLVFHQRALGAEVDLLAGSSFGAEGYGPVLGVSIVAPIQKGLNFNAGTDLWGSTTYHGFTVPNNWDWHLGLSGCKGRFCVDIGPTFVQRVDAINGAHTNFHLGLSYKFSNRLALVLGHISDAGTSNPNVGRQALSISIGFNNENRGEVMRPGDSLDFDGNIVQRLVDKTAYIERCNSYALQLVTSLAVRFPAVANFQAMPDLMGKLTQIDNMTARLPEGYGSANDGELIRSRERWKQRWNESQIRSDKLEAALRRFGGHAFMQCAATKVKTNALGFMIDGRDPCTCGWDETAKLLTPLETKGDQG